MENLKHRIFFSFLKVLLMLLENIVPCSFFGNKTNAVVVYVIFENVYDIYIYIYIYYIYIYIIYIFLNMLHNVIYIITRYKILYNIKHHIRYFIHMDFSSLLTLVETNFAKVLTGLLKKLYPPLFIMLFFSFS